MNHSKCTLEINLSAIKANYDVLCSLTNAAVGASVKANAYGLGASQISPTLKQAGCKNFFVSCCEEGVNLRKALGANVNIYVLHGVFKNELDFFQEYGLIPVLNHLAQIALWQGYAAKMNKKLSCLIHLNTGMHRLGLSAVEIESIDLNIDTSRLNILYIMSHLTSAEDIKSPVNRDQLAKFEQYSTKFGGIKRSLANSSAIFLGPGYHFDLVRPGAALYGINPTPYADDSKTKNPIKLLAPIIQLHELPPGNSLGYNNTYTNTQNKSCRIATLPIGYADGFSRVFSNKGEVCINGFLAPIIGSVSMDLLTIDVSKVPSKDLFLGADVEIIGDHCTPDMWATLSNTNTYEILTMLGDRYKRIYN